MGYDLIKFGSKQCPYTYMCKYVCRTCFRITTLSKHLRISLTKRDPCIKKDLTHHFLLCIKSKNRMQRIPKHTYMIKQHMKKTYEKNVLLILYALIFKNRVESIDKSPSFRTQPTAQNSPRDGCHCVR